MEFNYDTSPKIDVGFGYLSSYSNPTSLEENNSSSLNELTSTEGNYEIDKEYHSLNVFLKSKLNTLGKIMKVDFKYNEDIQALYINFQKNLGKWGV